MANTRVQDDIEEWIRTEWMPQKIGGTFERRNIRLAPGGEHSFDAVSDDGAIVACVATSGTRTASRKLATGKLHKVRSDLYYLLLTGGDNRKLYLCTEEDMKSWGDVEKQKGLIPRNVEFHHVSIPKLLREKLEAARRVASDEML